MKKIKIFLIILCSVIFFNTYQISYSALSVDVNVSHGGSSNSNDQKIKNGILNSIKNDVVVKDRGSNGISGFFVFVKDQIFKVIAVIAIAMIIWIGIRIASARGNPEEFKKAWIHLVYLILGIFIVFASWGIVKLVVGLKDIF